MIADPEAVNARVSIKVFADLFVLEGIRREDFEASLGRGAQEYVRAGARVHGLELTDEQVEQTTRLRQEHFLTILRDEPLPPFPGALELMEKARNREDSRVAIVTSGTLEKSSVVLDTTKIPYRQMVYISGNDVKSKKPDPELFLLAQAGIGIDPANRVVIEGAPNGIQAAGAECNSVTNSAHAVKLQEADLICSSLEQIDLDTITKLLDHGS